MADNVTIKDASGANVVTGTDEVTIGGVLQQVQRMKLVDGSDGGTSLIGSFPAGFLRVTDEPRQVFYDPFEGAAVDANLWVATTAGSGSAGVATGNLNIATGATTASYVRSISVPSFRLSIPSWLGFSFALSLPDADAPVTGTYRSWGTGTIPAAPTTATTNRVTDGAVFEIDTDGKMYAAVYAAGVRTVIADLSAATGNAKQPTNTALHRYIIAVRTDKTYWWIDGVSDSALVAQTNPAVGNTQSPNVQVLPTSIVALNGATTTNAQITVHGAAVWDTGKNATQIADGLYPHRKVQVGKTGGLAVKGAGLTAVATPYAAAAVGATAAYDASEAGNVTFVIKNTVAATAYTGNPVIVFEQSDDNVSWSPLVTVRNDTGAANSTHLLPAGAANASLVFEAGIEAMNYVRARVTTGTVANGMTIVITGGGMAFTPIVSTVSGDTKPTYRASTSVVFVSHVSTAFPFLFISGSNTKTIKLKSIVLSGQTLTAVAYLNVICNKYSAVPTGGTATLLTKVPLDSQNPAATASVVSVYTAVPTAGATNIGAISSRRNLGQATTAAAAGIPEIIEFNFEAAGGHSPVLRGGGEGVGLSWATAPASAVSMLARIEWTEE